MTDIKKQMVCSGCGVYIEWVKMKSGKMMPCDPAPVTIVTSDGKVETGFISHFATCPKANQLRKKQ